MRVFLLHGMARSVAAMAILAWRLERASHKAHLFGYQVVTEDLEGIAGRLVERVTRVLAEDARARQEAGGEESDDPEPYAIIGHSLGNVITRLASPQLPAGWSRFILLAPPNRPSTLAKGLRHNRLFRLLTGDAGRRLADPAFFDRLPVPDV
ncbi:MAG: alpha/beta hydrolase, partial [Acidobacteria bacterium]|nr:alpha/beta hydrolase [Acidobacteriota bacterium]